MEKPEGNFWSTRCGARLCSTAVWPKPEGSGPCMWPDTLNSLPCLAYCYRVSPLHRNLQVANFQGHKRAFHHRQAWVTLQLSPCLLLQSAPLSPSSRQYFFLPVHPMPALGCQLLYGTAVFVCVYVLCIICMKSIINLLQYSITEWVVSWVLD